jgi:hypothetical protein
LELYGKRGVATGSPVQGIDSSATFLWAAVMLGAFLMLLQAIKARRDNDGEA